jgi:phage shock protein A
MPLFHRVRDLLSANLHDVVDRLEEPEQMMRHAVREMEATLHRATLAAARSIAAERLVERELSACRQRAESAQDLATRAFHAGDEVRARLALEQKCCSDRQIATLERDRQRVHENNFELRQRIDQMQQKLAEARQVSASATARQRVAEARREFAQATHSAATGSEVIGRFERLRARVAAAEAEADAWVELTSPHGESDARTVEELEDAATIERALAELRAAT